MWIAISILSLLTHRVFYITIGLSQICFNGVDCMSYNFNWNAVSGGAPYVTISSIALAFNSVSIEKLGNPDQVIVGFDERQCVIGVKAYSGEPNIKAYDFARKMKNGWVRLGCKDFVKYLESLIKTSFSPSKKYVATYDDKEMILLVFVGGKIEREQDE